MPERANAGRIPAGVIERLPEYLNALFRFRAEGAHTVSSADLSSVTGINPAQIRRDLTHFGSFGKRGVGYPVAALIDGIQHILGSDQIHRLVLVGAGNLGTAIASYDGLRSRGFHIVAIFDAEPAKVGRRVGDFIVKDVSEMEEFVRDQNIHIGVLAVPQDAAQGVAESLATAGVRVLLNYSSSLVAVGGDVVVHNTDPVRELLHTLFYLSRA